MSAADVSGPTTSWTGADALVDALVTAGVDTVFALPGFQIDALFAAFHDRSEHLRVIHTRHEQATSHMADGYARTTGRTGVCAVVPGAGLLNALTGLSTAYSACSPVLCIAGQIPSALIGAGSGALHEIDDQLDVVAPVTKQARRVTDPLLLAEATAEALAATTTAPARPVELEVPPDVLSAAVPAPTSPTRQGRSGTPDSPDPAVRSSIDETAAALARAERPVLVAGGGVLSSGSWEALREIAELLDAPVVMTTNGRGALSDRHPLAHSLVSADALGSSADVVVMVGTRAAHPLLPDLRRRDDQLRIAVDVDDRDRPTRLPPTSRIVADAAVVLPLLRDALAALPMHSRDRRDELRDLKAAARRRLDDVVPQAHYGAALRAHLPDDAIVVNESTQVGMWSSIGFEVYEPRTFVTPGYQGALGYGLPTALGAKVGNPDRHVVSINGDGGFFYGVQELSTIAAHQIGVTIVVFNDGAYGNVKRIQQTQYDGRVLGVDLFNPDLVALARLFDIPATRVDTPAALAGALRRHDGDTPLLIDVAVAEMPSPGQVLGWPPPVSWRPRR